ncbi:unnamed protein product [Rotaria sordida]|uniref:Uncharacterized protein n=2 Tax=Rotaria sordida TaxID=392033 RepID=A0A813U733_9BILA|nr:unnamed protein product [Rotaria sordida]CAF0779571.1 unnamed protein product [Rotaria sordida]CAF0818670.1 unnamed protein product [Rotaria sordida]CAF3531294.1 unnamed protein product [Rotaria sordida]
MASFNEKTIYELNDEYSIILIEDFNNHLKIELYQNQILTYDVLLNDHQCSTITHKLCETKAELYNLLCDLLITMKSSISVTNSRYLEISLPIYFGHEKTRTKVWIFKIEFQRFLFIDNKKMDEISLDPLDWTEIRSLGHQIMDDMINYLSDIRLRPAWRPMPAIVRKAIAQTDIPLKGQSPFEVYDEVCSLVLPYSVGNNHPHFWGYVQGTGSLIGAFAEFITGTMNTMSWGGHQASIYIERQILSWLKVLMNFPNDDTSSGLLVSGTSVATIIAMAVARKKFCNRTMKVYCSKEAHSCLIRAIDLLNIGKENIISISTNSERQIDLKALEAALDPYSCGFIVGSAGTVATGAIDDLKGLANICARRPNDLWFHIDGAIGAVARCSKRLRPLFNGFEHADSIAFDLHKWLFVPYECGCILIRHGELHKSTFSQPAASYLTLMDGGITPSEGEVFFSDYGLELSRNMKSLKVWMTLKTYGIEKFGQIMEQNVDQAKHFVRLIEQYSNQFEVLTTGPLNIVCFRCIVSRSHVIDLEILNKLNKQMLITIQERGTAVVSPIAIDHNKFGLRMCITNHRTKMSDIDKFMEQLSQLADELLNLPEYSCLLN